MLWHTLPHQEEMEERSKFILLINEDTSSSFYGSVTLSYSAVARPPSYANSGMVKISEVVLAAATQACIVQV